MNRQDLRQFVQHSLTLAAMSVVSGCGIVPRPWPFATGGTKVPRIGYLALRTTSSAEIEAFRDGLHELGYVEGQSITIEVRLAESPGSTPAVELVALPVDAIVTSGATGEIESAMAATRTIPIIFAAAPDPVRTGYVASLARPGGT
jgi:putative tryptophan/tyrosine transport system substrate-binding protein